MARRPKRNQPPIQVKLDRLDRRHTSGLDLETGERWAVRAAPVGAVVEARRGRKNTARRMSLVEPAPDQVEPGCPAFGTCGGCQLQEMPLARQRQEKGALLERLVELEPDDGVRRHPVVGAPEAYGYRNKLELSWGSRRYVPELQLEAFKASGQPFDGSFLGFHPPGWFGRIVPLDGCPIGTPAMNEVISRISALNLSPGWNPHDHSGTWRHLVLRDGGTPEAPQLLVTLVTSSDATPADLDRITDVVRDVPGLRGLLWVVTDRLSEVAQGELRAVLWGQADLDIDIGRARLQLPHDAFFQVNTPGARVLLDHIDHALRLDGGADAGTLLDLYCGVGAIGLALAGGFRQVIGIELHGPAIDTARQNAARNGVAGSWHAGAVEAVLPTLDLPDARRLVVDPPRAGLHPKAARFLADFDADVLVYVSCGPPALARDRKVLAAGGWRLTDLWGVDLFPQTHHIESVARFVRDQAGTA